MSRWSKLLGLGGGNSHVGEKEGLPQSKENPLNSVRDVWIVLIPMKKGGC